MFPRTFYYQLFQPLFSLLLLPLYFFVPESPRWLYSVGRKKEAYIVLKKILIFNGKKEVAEEVEAKLVNYSNEENLKNITRGKFILYQT